MTQQTSTTNSSSQTQPWTPQIPYITQGLNVAGQAYTQSQNNANNPNYAAPTQFTAGLTPQQLQTFGQMIGYGQNSGVANSMINPSTGMMTGGANATGNALTSLGAFNPASTNNMNANIIGANNYVQGANIPAQVAQAMVAANQEAKNVTLPGINASAAGSGNSDSSRTGVAQGLVQQGLAENAQNMSGALSGQAFSTGANLASNTNTVNNAALLSALQGEGSLGSNAFGAGGSGLLNSISGQNNLYSIANTGGAGLQAGNQANLTNQLQGYNFGQSSPFQAPSSLLSLVGANYGGSESQGTSQTTTTPSLLSDIMGGLGAAGSLATGLGGSGGLLNSLGAIGGGAGDYGGYSAALNSMGAQINPSGYISMMSDRRVKKDIKKIGEIGGENVYSFNYIHEATKKDKPKHVGLMAQEVEKYAPHAVSSVGGIKAVDYPSAIGAILRKAA